MRKSDQTVYKRGENDQKYGIYPFDKLEFVYLSNKWF